MIRAYIFFFILENLKLYKASLDMEMLSTHQTDSKKPNDLIIMCRENKTIVFEYEIWSKFHYFKNEPGNNPIETFYTIDQDYDYKQILIIKSLAKNEEAGPICLQTFLNIVKILNLYSIKEDYRTYIFKNLVSQSFTSEFADEILMEMGRKNLKLDLTPLYELHGAGFIAIWSHFFFIFDYCIIISGTYLYFIHKNSETLYETPFVNIDKIKELVLVSVIPNNEREMGGKFVTGLKIFFRDLFKPNFYGNKIKTITITRSFSRYHLKALNRILESTSSIQTLRLEGIFKDYKFGNPKPIVKILEKYTSLKKFELTLGAFVTGKTMNEIFKNKQIKKVLSGLKIIGNPNICADIAKRISKLIQLEILYLSNCKINTLALNHIFSGCSKLRELSLINIQGVENFHARSINKCQNLEKLIIEFCSFNCEDLNIILGGTGIRNKLKELSIINNVTLNHLFLIEKFLLLERLNIKNHTIEHTDIINFLSNINITQNIREFSTNFQSTKQLTVNSEVLLNLNSLDVFDFRCFVFNSQELHQIFGRQNWQQNIKSLIFREDVFLEWGHYEKICKFRNLMTFEIHGVSRLFKLPLTENLKMIYVKHLLKRLHLSKIWELKTEDLGFILQFENLTDLSLHSCGMSSNVLTSILSSRFFQKSLKCLHLKNIPRFSISHAKLLDSFKNLETLKIGCGMSLKSIKEILRCKNLRKHLKVLDLSNNKYLSESHIKKILKFQKLSFLFLNASISNFAHLLPIFENRKFTSRLLEICLYQNFKGPQSIKTKVLKKFAKEQILARHEKAGIIVSKSKNF